MTIRQLWYWRYGRARKLARLYGAVPLSTSPAWAAMDLLCAQACGVAAWWEPPPVVLPGQRTTLVECARRGGSDGA